MLLEGNRDHEAIAEQRSYAETDFADLETANEEKNFRVANLLIWTFEAKDSASSATICKVRYATTRKIQPKTRITITSA